MLTRERSEKDTPMVDQALRIVPALDEDRRALAEICLRTAAAGEDATGLYGDADLPGSFWVLPYAAFEPELAFVLRDGNRVLGYVVGARDTPGFLARLDRDWWPALRKRYAGFGVRTDHDRRAMARLAEPEPLDPRLLPYPAHLHINLLPEAQRGGWGRRMVERELAALAAAGAKAVHLGVSIENEGIVAFYGKLGFERLFETETAIYMGRSL
jgi:ribosomal protein S18 acetylase RimI-like enzyme